MCLCVFVSECVCEKEYVCVDQNLYRSWKLKKKPWGSNRDFQMWKKWNFYTSVVTKSYEILM